MTSGARAAVTVEEPWVRATVPGQAVGAAYLTLLSSEPAVLVAVQTPVAKQAEIHETTTQGAVTRMRAVSRLELPPGRAVALKPGGHHIMLTNLARPLKTGDRVPLTLIIEGQNKKREQVQVVAEVRTATDKGDRHEHKH